MKSMRLIPEDTKIKFLSKRAIALSFSGLLFLISVVSLWTQGLNYGIDFLGGTTIEAAQPQTVDIANLRQRLGSLDLGQVQIQEFGDDKTVLIRVSASSVSQSAENELSAVGRIRSELQDFDIRRVEVVGPQISGELIRTGVIAVTLAIGAMLIYIWFRFEWQFGVGAVLALIHDVALTIGIFSLLQIEFNISILAAILTIVGYSMNDTVVVYDRVRETLRKFKKMNLDELLDLAINSTLSRTVMTSLTTLLALVALYILGGEVIRGFTFAMIWGIVVGTYSSIFIASPLLLFLGVKRDWSEVSSNTN